MTVEQKQDICIRELLFGRDFLSDYCNQLNVLFGDSAFMRVIEEISGTTSDEVEFSIDSNRQEFLTFKKSTVARCLLESELKNNFSAYQSICADVMVRKKSVASAAISVYYALRYFSLRRGVAESQEMESDADFRKKWNAVYRCEDGHYVRSKNEQLVDNWLYSHGVCHAYEMMIIDRRNGKEYICDFYIPGKNLYIEVWGYKSTEYLRRKEIKVEMYRANGCKLLHMTDSEIKVLDDFLKRHL